MIDVLKLGPDQFGLIHVAVAVAAAFCWVEPAGRNEFNARLDRRLREIGTSHPEVLEARLVGCERIVRLILKPQIPAESDQLARLEMMPDDQIVLARILRNRVFQSDKDRIEIVGGIAIMSFLRLRKSNLERLNVDQVFNRVSPTIIRQIKHHYASQELGDEHIGWDVFTNGRLRSDGQSIAAEQVQNFDRKHCGGRTVDPFGFGVISG